MLVDTERMWHVVSRPVKAALCNFCATSGTKRNDKNTFANIWSEISLKYSYKKMVSNFLND